MVTCGIFFNLEIRSSAPITKPKPFAWSNSPVEENLWCRERPKIAYVRDNLGVWGDLRWIAAACVSTGQTTCQF